MVCQPISLIGHPNLEKYFNEKSILFFFLKFKVKNHEKPYVFDERGILNFLLAKKIKN